MEPSTFATGATIVLIMAMIGILLWGSRSRKTQCMNCRRLYYPENSTADPHYSYLYHSDECRKADLKNYWKIHGR